MVPFLISAEMAHSMFYRTLMISAVIDGFNVYDRVGRPQFNAAFAQSLLSLEYTYHFLYSLMAWASATPVHFVLVPVMIRAAASLYPYVSHVLPPALAPVVSRIPKTTHSMFATVALFEVILAIVLVPLALTPARSIMFLFLLAQLIHMRYVASVFTRRAISTVVPYADSVFNHPRMPGVVTRGYEWAKQKAWSTVDPESLKQRGEAMQNQSCSIM